MVQCNTFDAVTCGGALCFGSEEEHSDHSDFDEESSAHNSDQEEKANKVDADELFDCSVNKEGVTETSMSSHKNERNTCEEHTDEAKAAGTEAVAADNGESNRPIDNSVPNIGMDKNLDGGASGNKEIVFDNEDDDVTVDTALEMTQDVSSEDESADVEPADVKIELGDDDVDAALVDLDDEFAPKKDDEVSAGSENETTEEKDDEKSIDANKTEHDSEENFHDAPIQLVENEINPTPQQQQWNAKYSGLLKYYNKYNTSTIALKASTKPKHVMLRLWTDKQRKAFVNDELSPDQIQKLVAVDFDFGEDIDELVADKIEQERIEAERKKAEALRLEEEAKAAAVRAEEKHLEKLRKRMNHKKMIEKKRAEAISVVVGS